MLYCLQAYHDMFLPKNIGARWDEEHTGSPGIGWQPVGHILFVVGLSEVRFCNIYSEALVYDAANLVRFPRLD